MTDYESNDGNTLDRSTSCLIGPPHLNEERECRCMGKREQREKKREVADWWGRESGGHAQLRQ